MSKSNNILLCSRKVILCRPPLLRNIFAPVCRKQKPIDILFPWRSRNKLFYPPLRSALRTHKLNVSPMLIWSQNIFTYIQILCVFQTIFRLEEENYLFVRWKLGSYNSHQNKHQEELSTRLWKDTKASSLWCSSWHLKPSDMKVWWTSTGDSKMSRKLISL